MYENKKILLIGGGGTLGTHVGAELLRLGATVDVICPEDKTSDNPRLTFYKSFATEEFLTELFKGGRYDGIVDFVHYQTPEEYKPFHELIAANTDHLIFLSSYRVYADLEHPITEDSPRLLDTSSDREFVETERYAISKARCEDYLRNESKYKNWTIVRPVISSSRKRFDIVMCTNHEVEEKAISGEPLYVPECAKNLTAGLDWAGNVGKIIAHLLLKKNTLGETYTISSAQNLTWGEVADIYTDILGVKFIWLDEETYMAEHKPRDIWAYLYDRKFDRKIDNSKVLAATGLTAADFAPIKDGIIAELKLTGAIK